MHELRALRCVLLEKRGERPRVLLSVSIDTYPVQPGDPEGHYEQSEGDRPYVQSFIVLANPDGYRSVHGTTIHATLSNKPR